MNDFYEFDPTTFDESEDEQITLDNWKPSKKESKIIQSEWRKRQIGTNFNQEPGVDDLKKIQMFLKKKRPDAEVMTAFGISAEVLVAIKKGFYCPMEGINMDNINKIQKEFKRVDEIIKKLRRGADYIAEILFIDKKDLKKYKDCCDGRKGKKDSKNVEKKAMESSEMHDEEE